jgi:hypothetical protein
MQAWKISQMKSSNRKIKDGLKYATTMGLDRTNQQHYHNENGSSKSRRIRVGL